MRSNKAAIIAAVVFLALFSVTCRKPRGDQPGAASPASGTPRSAHWEVAYQSPQSLNQPEVPLWSYNSISVVSPNVVFVAADYPTLGNMEKRIGIIVRTTDGGATWIESQLQVKDIDLAALNAIKFVSPTTGWAVGVDGSGFTDVFKTTDGGQTWAGKKTSFKQSPTSVFFSGKDNGWIGGVATPPDDPEGEAGPSDIMASIDGGSTWSPQYHLPVSINDLSFTGGSSGWAGGIPASIYHTSDGGKTWGPQHTGLEGGAAGTAAASKFGMRTVYFVDDMHGWAGAADTDDNKSMVLGTTNGGVNWTPLWIMNDEIVRDVLFVNQQEGWAVTSSGEYAYHTTDGGHRWLAEVIKFPQRVTFYRLGAADANRVWAVGGGAIIRRVEE